MATKDDLKIGIDGIINVLESWKANINDQNFSNFDIYMSEHRDLDPIHDPESMLATGFRQASPIMLDIRLEDHRKSGKEL